MRVIAAPAVVLFGLAVASSSAAYAAVTETIVYADTAAVLGSITFPALSGAGSAGIVFSYAGFSESEITSIDWALNPSTEAVTALNLHALQGNAVRPPVSPGVCSNTTLTLSSSSASEVFTSCDTTGEFPSCGESEGPPQNIAFIATVVPEPATWLLGVTGFLGLGALRLTGGRFAAFAG
jgi:hypothetical protein